jgi:hypothetical protein
MYDDDASGGAAVGVDPAPTPVVEGLLQMRPQSPSRPKRGRSAPAFHAIALRRA